MFFTVSLRWALQREGRLGFGSNARSSGRKQLVCESGSGHLHNPHLCICILDLHCGRSLRHLGWWTVRNLDTGQGGDFM
jgi:hypothetical protein